MFQVLADAHIPEVSHYFPKKFFNVTLYHNHVELLEKIKRNQILLCRSVSSIDHVLLEGTNIFLVASASSGSNHVDKPYLKRKKIAFIDAKGGNAPAVTDYMCTTLASLNQHFSFKAQKIAILGYGHVGQRLSLQLQKLGYTIGIYDPFKQNLIPKPLRIELSDLHHFDTICLHPNYHIKQPFPSHHLIDSRFSKMFTSNTCIINASRGNVVDEDFILSPDYQGLYCTDVFVNEPTPNPMLIERATLATPHIAGHSIESKLRLTELIANKIYQHLNLSLLPHSLIQASSIQIENLNWQKAILEQYDPYIDTQALKQTHGQNFIELRHAHHRHEFSWSNP